MHKASIGAAAVKAHFVLHSRRPRTAQRRSRLVPLRHLHAAREQSFAAVRTATLSILPTLAGKARTPRGVGNTVSRVATAASLTNRTWHDLRTSRLIALAEIGSTTHQIAAWGGHESRAEIGTFQKAPNAAASL